MAIRIEDIKEDDSVKKSIELLLDEYKLSLDAANRSRKTISWYLDILNRYFTFLTSNSLMIPIRELGKRELTSYILHLQSCTRWPNKTLKNKDNGKLSPYSIQGHVRAIKAFWSWLFEYEYIEKNPLAKFPLPKVPECLMPIISREQFDRLVYHIDRNTIDGAKYYLILLMLFGMGLRISELVTIQLDDIEYQAGQIKVIGKGQKERLVPAFHKILKEIRRYLRDVRVKLSDADSPYLFPCSHGGHISIGSVQQYIGRLKIDGLSGKRLSPHKFRHSFATICIAKGMDISDLKEIMGHSSIQTTLKYTHQSSKDIKKHYDKFSPLSD